jgi:hypothetical protein
MLKKTNLYFLIGLFAAVSLLVSCGNDDDENPDTPLIVGTWNYSTHKFEGSINGQSIVNFLVENLDLTPLQAQAYEAFFISSLMADQNLEGSTITFNSDGTYSATENGVVTETGTYVLRDNNTVLVLDTTDGVQEFDVKELTRNRMVISFTGVEEEDITEDGVPEAIGFTFDITFVK